jgi:hypothetical protein
MMVFPAKVLRILIASPSDVSEERELVVRAIQEWNDLNAAERHLVLLPVRWETHSAPEYGKRPQEIINRQVVDVCDLGIGIFWTKIGTPTGSAESGTLEEIERVAASGKTVMLYFSKAKQDPEAIDPDQLRKLREFKSKTMPTALIEHYAGQVDFKEKVSKQLQIQVRALLAKQSEHDGSPRVEPVTDIEMQFADPETGQEIGSEIQLETKFLNISDFETLPDYRKEQAPAAPTAKGSEAYSVLTGYLKETGNRDYYRQLVAGVVLRMFFKPVRLWLRNRGGIGARDVFIEIAIRSTNGRLIVVSKSQIPDAHPSKETGGLLGFTGTHHPKSPSDLIKEGSSEWTVTTEVGALQPQRQVSPNGLVFMLGAKESCDVIISARIYADTLPEPVMREVKLRLDVLPREMTASDALSVMIESDKEAGQN